MDFLLNCSQPGGSYIRHNSPEIRTDLRLKRPDLLTMHGVVSTPPRFYAF